MKVALITGGSSGLGLCIARKLAEKGWEVYIGSRRLNDGEEADGLHCLRLDVTKEESVARAVNAVMGQTGRIDALVNAAGYSLSCAVEDMTADELHAEMDVNLYGALRMVRQVLPVMRARGRGIIVNIGSVAGFITIPFQSAYSISKYAMEAFSEALYMECRPFGVRVTCVDPGDMRTGFTGNRIYANEVKSTAYRPYFDYAIHAMARDELHGAAPDKCAETVVKAILSGRNRPRIVVGFAYKAVNILRRLLPIRTSARVVANLYTKELPDDDLWSFDADVLGKGKDHA